VARARFGKIYIRDLYIKLFSAVRYAREGRDTAETAERLVTLAHKPFNSDRKTASSLFQKSASALWLSIFGR
jgi:hypothetical protein